MAIQNDWMAGTLGGKAAMFANVNDKIENLEAVLPLTPDQIKRIKEICQEFLAIYEFVTQSQATMQSITQWRDLAFYGNPKGTVLPNPVGFPVYIQTANSIIGLINAFRDYRELIVALPGYTVALGEDLMIVKTDSQGLVPNDVVPTIQVSAAQSNFLASIVVGERGDSDQWILETRKKGGEWVTNGTFTGKSADFTVAPTTPGEPFQLEVRIQLRRKNENYGQLSQIATVTMNP